MATKTFYIKSSSVPSAGDVKYIALQDGGTAPSAATLSAAGWNLSTATLETSYATMDPNPLAQLAPGGQTSTSALDNAIDWLNPVKGFRTESPLTCDIDSGNWTFSFSAISTVAASGAGKLRLKVWKSPMSYFPTQITTPITATDITPSAGVLETNSWSNLTISTAQNLTVTANFPLIELRNEYLYIQVEHQTTATSSLANANIVYRTDGTYSKITTPAFANVYGSNTTNFKQYGNITQSTAQFDYALPANEKPLNVNQSTAQFDYILPTAGKLITINQSTAESDLRAPLNYIHDSSVTIRQYFLMRGKDNVGEKTWIATGSPDSRALQYVGTITGTMTNIVVLKTWRARD